MMGKSGWVLWQHCSSIMHFLCTNCDIAKLILCAEIAPLLLMCIHSMYMYTMHLIDDLLDFVLHWTVYFFGIHVGIDSANVSKPLIPFIALERPLFIKAHQPMLNLLQLVACLWCTLLACSLKYSISGHCEMKYNIQSTRQVEALQQKNKKVFKASYKHQG